MAKKPNIKNAGLSFRNLTPINKSSIRHIVQHHMAHNSWHIQDVHNYHRNSLGWAGIGYNWWIDFDGNIYEGRGWHVGAHCRGNNSTSVGIGYQGNFENQQMTDAQVKAGKELNAWLMSELGLGSSAIVGHGDLVATTCPGRNFRMSEVKGSTTVKSAPKSKVASVSTSDYTGGSVVDYLNSIGKDSSFDNRKKLANAHGISNYTGTASQNTKLLNKLQSGKTPVSQADLTVDGKWGNATTEALQDALNTPVDGIISNQSRNSVTESLYGNTVRYGSGGSVVIRALQRKVGASADGLLGPATVRALQDYLGTPVDGVLSRPSMAVEEMQRQLNAGTF